MVITTLDGKKYTVKYKQNSETITNKFGVSVHEYPNFIGSKLNQNSSSSDIYNVTFAIHRTQLVSFKESIKFFLVDENDAAVDPTYGKVTDIILEHNLWGAIKGKFIEDIKYDTSSEADIICTGVFQEQSPDEAVEKKDLEVENTGANDSLDTATADGELDEFDKPALLNMLEKFNEIYDNIQNSAVIAALNDLESAVNSAILNYQKVMNAVKKVLSLPNNIFNNVRGKLDFFQKQHAAIKAIPRNTFNMTRFNIRILALNLGFSNRTPFVSKEAERARSGIKTAPIE